MRLFFALEFESYIRDYLYNIQNNIRQYCTAGNFSFKENFHLTLRFMGEQSPEQAQALKSALQHTAGCIHGFELKLDGIGKFDRGNRKIIWAGLQKSSQLKLLYGQLENELFRLGCQKEERGLSPHITLAREVRIEDYSRMAANIKMENKVISVNSVSLMESTRIENKLAYTAIAKNELLAREI